MLKARRLGTMIGRAREKAHQIRTEDFADGNRIHPSPSDFLWFRQSLGAGQGQRNGKFLFALEPTVMQAMP